MDPAGDCDSSPNVVSRALIPDPSGDCHALVSEVAYSMNASWVFRIIISLNLDGYLLDGWTDGLAQDHPLSPGG